MAPSNLLIAIWNFPEREHSWRTIRGNVVTFLIKLFIFLLFCRIIGSLSVPCINSGEQKELGNAFLSYIHTCSVSGYSWWNYVSRKKGNLLFGYRRYIFIYRNVTTYYSNWKYSLQIITLFPVIVPKRCWLRGPFSMANFPGKLLRRHSGKITHVTQCVPNHGGDELWWQMADLRASTWHIFGANIRHIR
jgi:hypothetical protein